MSIDILEGSANQGKTCGHSGERLKTRSDPSVKQYDQQAGVCLSCQALFDPIQDVAEKYGLDLGQLMADLRGDAESD